MLSLQFGVSIFGVVATVTAYMAGLGLGSLLGTRWSRTTTHPLRLFALLELAIAITALLIPLLFQLLDEQFSAQAATLGYSGWLSLQILVVIVVLMVPALAMGAGFPLILTAVQNTNITLGGIYGFNALGGALGALLPLWLLPTFGWLSSLRAVALLGCVIGAIALWLSWRHESGGNAPKEQAAQRPAAKWLLLYAGIGAGALLLEIGWTRLLGMVMLRTEYVLAIILAVFLLGIGFGSVLSRYLVQRFWFALLPIIASGFAILSLWWLPTLSVWAEQGQFTSLTSALVLQACAMATLTLPVTLVLGAWLPMLATHLGNRFHSGVWLYGANSLGAALGALLAGFVLVPTVGSSATIIVGAALLLILGLSMAQVWTRRPVWVAVVLLVLAAIPVMDMPSVSNLMPQAYGDTRLLKLREDAISISHVVERSDGQRLLLADMRRMDASSDPTAIVVQMNQVRLPLLLHPKPRKILLLGLGTGISASASLPYPELDRTAVELSLGAINAARNEFYRVNGGVTDKMHIVRDDARHYLQGTVNNFDVIVGDLFHPDLVGRSALLSRQQFQRARSRLMQGGVFVQWLALNQFDVKNLQVVLQTFRQVFPNAVMFVDAFRLAMVGVRDANVDSARVLNNLQRLSPDQADAVTGGEGPWTWLGRYWGQIPALKTAIQDEWAPVIEYQLPNARFSGGLDLSRVLSWLVSIRPGMADAARQLQIDDENFPHFERAYAATELAHRSWLALLHERPTEGRRLLPLAYQANPKDRWIGFALADAVLEDQAAAKARGLSERQLLESVLRIRPDHVEALKRSWQLAEQAGDEQQARNFRQRFAALNPLAIELRNPH